MFVFLVYLVNSFFLNTRTDFRSPDLEEFPDETKNASLKGPLLGLEVDFRHTLVSLINVRDPPSLTFRWTVRVEDTHGRDAGQETGVL